MSLSDNELENEYKEHYWVIRKFGFDTRDENVEELVKHLINYYWNHGYDDGYYDAEQEFGGEE